MDVSEQGTTPRREPGRAVLAKIAIDVDVLEPFDGWDDVGCVNDEKSLAD